MAAPQNVRATAAPYDQDPLLGYRFLILWDGTPVAGVSKIGSLSRKTEVVDFREGGAPQHVRRIPGQTSYEPITLERGLIIDPTFEQWANKAWFLENSGGGIPGPGQIVSLADFRKDITIQLCNQAGQVVKQYMAFNCWPSEYSALPELDASANSVALETMTLQNEGWQRVDDFAPPAPPSFTHPA